MSIVLDVGTFLYIFLELHKLKRGFCLMDIPSGPNYVIPVMIKRFYYIQIY